MIIELRNGKSYNFVTLGLTDEACALLELQEAENPSMSQVLRAMRNAIKQSLLAGGQTDAEAEEALGAIKILGGGDVQSKIMQCLYTDDGE